MLWIFLMEECIHHLAQHDAVSPILKEEWILFLRKSPWGGWGPFLDRVQNMDPKWIKAQVNSSRKGFHVGEVYTILSALPPATWWSWTAHRGPAPCLRSPSAQHWWWISLWAVGVHCYDSDTLPSAPELVVLQGCWNGWLDAANTNHRSTSQTKVCCANLVGNYTIYS